MLLLLMWVSLFFWSGLKYFKYCLEFTSKALVEMSQLLFHSPLTLVRVITPLHYLQHHNQDSDLISPVLWFMTKCLENRCFCQPVLCACKVLYICITKHYQVLQYLLCISTVQQVILLICEAQKSTLVSPIVQNTYMIMLFGGFKGVIESINE